MKHTRLMLLATAALVTLTTAALAHSPPTSPVDAQQDVYTIEAGHDLVALNGPIGGAVLRIGAGSPNYSLPSSSANYAEECKDAACALARAGYSPRASQRASPALTLTRSKSYGPPHIGYHPRMS